MAPPTTSELATLVHDLRTALEQHEVDAVEVREAAHAVLQALLPPSARDTVAPDGSSPPVESGAPWASGAPRGPATWSPEDPIRAGTWTPDALEAGTWAPGSLDDPTDETVADDEPTERIDAPDTYWEQGPGLQAPTDDTAPPGGPVDLEDWCRRILAGEVTAAEARAALNRWRPEGGAADKSGRYVIDQELGRGGMGQVLQADDVYLRRTVAIKVLTLPGRPARRRFVDEARLTARLQHPGVVPVHDVGETPDGKPFFAMKRIHGRSLHEVIHTGGMPQLAERLDVFKRVCEAMAYAHDAGVLHLDLKPDNVMVGDYGEVLVVDWGLAAEVGDGGAAMRQVAGTPAYMAPEQATAGASLDRRTDVYALGAVLYELLTDRPPIEAGAVTEMLNQVRTGSIPHPRTVRSSVPQELDALVQRCMSKDPAHRPPDALMLRDEVRAFQEHRELQSLQYGWWSRLEKWRLRNRAWVRGLTLAGSVGVVALLSATAIYVGQIQQARDEAEAQARRALEGQAESDLLLGRSMLAARRYQDADVALRKARRALEALSLPTDRVDLALAEQRAAGSMARKIPIPFPASHVHTDGRTVSFDDGTGRAGWVDVISGDVHDGPKDAAAVDTDFGLAWWVPTGTGHRLTSVDNGWSVDVPLGPGAHIDGHTIYSTKSPLAFTLEPTADGAMDLRPIPVDHGPCAGRLEGFKGPYVACERQAVDVLRGDAVPIWPMEADPTGDYLLSGSALKVQVFDREHQIRWEDRNRPMRSATYPGGVAWRDERGRIHARSWSTGRVELDLDATMTPPDSPIAVAPTQRLAVVGGAEALYLLRPAVDTQRDPETGGPARPYPYALALSPHGLVFGTRTSLHRSPTSAQSPVTWTEVPDADQPRDLDWSTDGTLAVALREEGLLFVHPDGRTERHSLDDCCQGVAWRGHDVAAVGTGPLLHERIDGAWGSSELPELSKGGWDVTPWGDDGWAISDYDRDEVYAVLVRHGAQVGTVAGPERELAFQIDARGEAIVVGTGAGGWVWHADETTRLEPSSYTMGATWSETGPVVAGADQYLRFYSPEGRLLHTWDVGEVVVTLGANDGAIAAAANSVRVFSLVER